MRHTPFYTQRSFYISIFILVIIIITSIITYATHFILTESDTLLAEQELTSNTISKDTEAYSILRQKFNLPDQAPKVTPETASTTKATSSPKIPPIDITTLSIQVLNGTHITGLAGRIRSTLITHGFTTVVIGNTKTRTTSALIVKEQLPDSVYKTIKESSDLLTDVVIATSPTLEYDIQILLGTE